MVGRRMETVSALEVKTQGRDLSYDERARLLQFAQVQSNDHS
jgi:hypothetical protein